ncbi:MAG: serine/threonine protein kinase [Gammaproteobacteria bacterium]|nr:serine/threonine protein kinase [Gammaproteobacteria bacterium]
MSVQNNQLPPGTVFTPYVIEKTLSAGGFSIVYLAKDTRNDQYVVIKEYLPIKLAQRDDNFRVIPINGSCQGRLYEGRQLFLLEVSALKRLDHPNVVHITDSFDALDTVYIVMEYKPGKNLQDYIHQHPAGLSEHLIRTIFPPLLDGLGAVHNSGLLHLDIKPGNIHLQSGGQPILLDFGAVIRKNMSRSMQPHPVVTAGFSPIEQHDAKGYCGPWSDIYAVGATIRSCIEGSSPPTAIERREKDTMRPASRVFKRKYSAALLETIDWAMEVDPLLRPQTINDFMAAFNQKVDSGNDSAVQWFVNHLPWVVKVK